MKEIKIKDLTVKIKEATDLDLDRFYKNWSLTMLGLSEDGIKWWVDQLYPDIKSELTEITMYVITGKLMNESYTLTGTNAYVDDLSIVVFDNNDIFKNLGKVAVERFTIGGRWFTDIVDNNTRREREKAGEDY